MYTGPRVVDSACIIWTAAAKTRGPLPPLIWIGTARLSDSLDRGHTASARRTGRNRLPGPCRPSPCRSNDLDGRRPSDPNPAALSEPAHPNCVSGLTRHLILRAKNGLIDCGERCSFGMVASMVERKVDIRLVLAALAAKRPMFHSEKDFQLHLAWELKSLGSEVCLEYHPARLDGNTVIDIFVERPERVAFALRYRMRPFRYEIKGQRYALKANVATYFARYDFWRDVERIETVVGHGTASRGCVLFLTNAPQYLSISKRKDANDAAFRMHEGRAVSAGSLKWSPGTAAGSMKGLEKPIYLSGRYTLHWSDYSKLPGTNGRFRYLLLEV